jgi:hypothetical protein
MNRAFIGLSLLGFAAPLAAEPPCLLCDGPTSNATPSEARRPIRIEIESALDFSRVARTEGAGSVALDPKSGQRRVTGGLADLGGMAVRGTVRVTGEPFAPVQISLPHRVTLRSTHGGQAEVLDLETDAPAQPRFDSSGNLNFSFGGRLVVNGPISGMIRGSVPISVDYE